MMLSSAHYPDMPLNSVSVHKSEFAVCEGVEVRVADFSLTGSGYDKILPRSGRFRGRGGRSEARWIHHGIDIKEVSKGR